MDGNVPAQQQFLELQLLNAKAFLRALTMAGEQRQPTGKVEQPFCL